MKRVVISVIGSATLIGVLGAARAWIRPSISRNRIRTASPIDSRVVKILKRPGAVLHRGDPILELDVSQSVLNLEKLEMALKENQQSRRKLELQNTLINLQARVLWRGCRG